MKEQIRGSLLGLAWGDVLGCPMEGWRSGSIQNIYGHYSDLPPAYDMERLRVLLDRKQMRRLRPLGLHSDDTQQAMALIAVCQSPGHFSVEKWSDWLVAGQKRDAWRGIGRNFVAALHRLKRGMDPRRSGSESAGMGAAMRSAVLGAIYRDAPERLARVSMEQALMTHADIRAAALCFAVARCVQGFLSGEEARTLAKRLPDDVATVEAEWLEGAEDWEFAREGGHQLSNAMHSVLPKVFGEDPEHIRKHISKVAKPHLREGFKRAHPNQGFALLGGLHAIAMALACTDDPQESLCEIVRQGFDTDTVAAICGGILGARFGCDWIPTERFVDLERLNRYADALVTGEPVDDIGSFMTREAELTEQERAFQRAQT